MASEGPNNPGTVVNQDIGYVDWVNPENAKISDNNYATATVNNERADRLFATNFGFSIPIGVIINGILCEVEGKTETGNVILVPEVHRAGAGYGKENITLTTTEGYSSFGSPTDPINSSFTPEVINGSSFGCAVRVSPEATDTISVNHIRITVYYTAIRGPFPTHFRV